MLRVVSCWPQNWGGGRLWGNSCYPVPKAVIWIPERMRVRCRWCCWVAIGRTECPVLSQLWLLLCLKPSRMREMWMSVWSTCVVYWLLITLLSCVWWIKQPLKFHVPKQLVLLHRLCSASTESCMEVERVLSFRHSKVPVCCSCCQQKSDWLHYKNFITKAGWNACRLVFSWKPGWLMGSKERELKTGNASPKPFFMCEMEGEGDEFYISCKVTMSSSGFLQMENTVWLIH